MLLEETLEYLAPGGRDELMIDATMGEGGHSYAFLSRFPDLCVVGVEKDSAIQERARERLAQFGSRVQFYHDWSQDFFEHYPAALKRPDIVLADLGISLFHYREGGRGFAFEGDEALDMRLDTSRGAPASEILARMSEAQIADILYKNSGERYSRRISRAIVQQRPINTNTELSQLVKRAVPASYRYGPIHPATRTFMALRIEVNEELSGLPSLLNNAFNALKPGGKLGVISFHSLEDRVVKNFFRMKKRDCSCPPEAPKCTCAGRELEIVTPKGVIAGEAEIRQNPPSRSARLRVAQKIKETVI